MHRAIHREGLVTSGVYFRLTQTITACIWQLVGLVPTMWWPGDGQSQCCGSQIVHGLLKPMSKDQNDISKSTK